MLGDLTFELLQLLLEIRYIFTRVLSTCLRTIISGVVFTKSTQVSKSSTEGNYNGLKVF